jgi:hypothetical protein
MFVGEAHLIVLTGYLMCDWKNWRVAIRPEVYDYFMISLKFSLLLVPLFVIGIAIAFIVPLRWLARLIGLRRPSTGRAVEASPKRELRIYFRLLMVSQAIAAVFYALYVIAVILFAD